MKQYTLYITEYQQSKINGFCILKPEFLNYKEAWLTKLQDNGWNIINLKEITLSLKEAKELYMPHKDKDFYNDLCKYMSSNKCVCITCYKECDDPIKQMDELKNKIRNKWGEDDMKNVMHSSDSIKNIKRESNIIFN